MKPSRRPPAAAVLVVARLLRRGIRLLLAAWLSGVGLAAAAQATVPPVLSLHAPAVDAWPAVTVLPEPDGPWTLAQAQRRVSAFAPPAGPHANLGVRREAVWLRVLLSVPAGDDGRWLIDIDYPSLDRIDVHLVTDGAPVRHLVLGDHLPYNTRPLLTRSHAARLVLEPGRDHQLWLRVQTRSTMIVPLRLVKPEAAHANEMGVQMAQGLIAGLALCLALYALAQWLGSRDPMFLYYALSLVGVGLFFLAYYGLAPQHLWPDHTWLTDNAAPVFVLIGIGGATLLVERLLDVRASSPRLARVLQVLAVVAFAASALFVLGVIGYRTASLTGSVLGPMPILLGVHLAWRQARAGDEAARYVLIGWAAYAAGILVMAALLRGVADSNVWTQHAFQAGWLCESIAWMRVLGVRAGTVRRQMARAQHERELLERMAHTDPLTGLPNRRGLDLALKDALAHTSPPQGLAVYVIDLDGFKAINDRLGHDAGDELLVAAAARMKATLRSGDVVARLGGDEFVVLARQMKDESVAWQVGRKLLQAYRAPFRIAGQDCEVGLTIGFALAPQDGSRAADLLKCADVAMYAGKHAGKGTVRHGGGSSNAMPSLSEGRATTC